ncbi:hypothetical protein PROSTU_00563 [Providencia stuartii ATCC 25827]|uniref:Uncharacterized protein n=1 Tax=Providencia stuartii ATCC 25827 TaxID=471874 RepID=A0AA86YZP1_PROST|nr:hypothetical protein PROSTU_00563 [Providencia stuartii ATCC 25827]
MGRQRPFSHRWLNRDNFTCLQQTTQMISRLICLPYQSRNNNAMV